MHIKIAIGENIIEIVDIKIDTVSEVQTIIQSIKDLFFNIKPESE